MFAESVKTYNYFHLQTFLYVLWKKEHVDYICKLGCRAIVTVRILRQLLLVYPSGRGSGTRFFLEHLIEKFSLID